MKNAIAAANATTSFSFFATPIANNIGKFAQYHHIHLIPKAKHTKYAFS